MNSTTRNEVTKVLNTLETLTETLMGYRTQLVRETAFSQDTPEEVLHIQTLADNLTRLVAATEVDLKLYGGEGDPVPDFDIDGGEKYASPLAEKIHTALPFDWSEQDLANASGVSRTTVRNVLDGKTLKPHTKTLRAFEEALGMNEGDLDA